MRALLFPLALIAAVSLLQAAEPGNTLLPNGDFEGSSSGSGGWASNKGAAVEVEDGNHFLRLQSTEPNTQVQSHRKIKIPGGTQKVKVTFRARYENIIPGAENWHIGSLVMHWRDSNGGIVKPEPKAFRYKGKSDGWVEQEVVIDVPEGATELEFLPALFQVQQGTLDFDDFVVIAD